ncbi:bile acid:sodium symporter family protein [Qipengyuania spongiae]|uniref:Bile acid:sodium symporter n=1 Tax=Qipengyuania spongiae TaxID=2909673 RepID=A0ABY5SWP7_9SPHN|nr:bile acid:sodium symporter family protein [Qipengyuania spongiae]UVI38740.1 bile acid:sodium symporter [Qipengyuania spongiae]
MMIRAVLGDPMLRMLAGAIALAALVPATGTGREIAGWIVDAAIFTLFLLNGMRIARRDIGRGIANWRFLVPLILWVFGAMALAGLGLSRIGNNLLPPLIAVGFLYLGALPSTVQSATSYTSLAGGNIAMSVVGAALLNILGVFVTVPIFLALGGAGEGAVGFETVQKIALILLLPFVMGQIVQGWTTSFIARHKPKIVWIDRFVIAIAVYVAFSGAVEQGIWQRLDATAWAILSALVAVLLLFANAGAWLLGGVLDLPGTDRTAFLFGGAQKSAAIGVPLATILFSPAAAGFVVVPLLLYHLFQLVVAAPVASRLALRMVASEETPASPSARGD